jgi:MoaA/NifB/PqqE/SkfB family radical SAM enzyme
MARLPHEALQLAGWYHGERALTGPTTVQIDLTDACNQSCEVCWLHAPALQERNRERRERRASIPWDRYVALLDELAAMGTQEIYFAGGGEPLAYPRPWDALREAVTRGLTASLHTNFSLVDDPQRLIDLGIHHVTVSLWAGTSEAYAATHPGTDPATFDAVTDNLRELNRRKRDRPVSKLYHVLTGSNAHEVGAMLALAEDLGCDAVEFAVADVVPGATDPHALTPAQARQALDALEPWLDRAAWRTPRLLAGASVAERLRNLAEGRAADAAAVHAIPCFAGWTYARVMADGRVIPCLKAHRIPSGTIHESSFADIWHGQRQAAFRQATRHAAKRGPLFASIGNDPSHACGCELGCDNLQDNRRVAARLRSLSRPERALLAAAGRVDAVTRRLA